jgi:ribosomal protein L3
VKFLGSCEGTRISVTVTEFPSVVVAEAKQESGVGAEGELEKLFAKNGQFFEKWKHDPRPMVTRFTGVNPKRGMTLKVLTVDFTDGDSVFFSLSRSRATKNGSTGQIVDFLEGGIQHRTTSTSSGA